jgi:5'-3' exonuclease
LTKIVHIDGDILVYAGGFAAERGEYAVHYMADGYGREETVYFPYKKDVDAWVEANPQVPMMVEFVRTPEPVEYALSNVKNIIESIIKETNASDYVVYLSGPTNFRDTLATIRPYKGNRDKAHKPVHGPAIREYLNRSHPCIVSDGEEADDVLAYTHYARYLTDMESSVIATQDKDLDMIPGEHYNFAKKQTYFVIESEADYNFYKQLLTGDPTDNIQGCPGIGPKRAAAILAGKTDVQEMYEAVRGTYHNDEALLENARLLWIRREPKQEWSPPNAVHQK